MDFTDVNQINLHIKNALEYLQKDNIQNADMMNANDAIAKAYIMVKAQNTMIEQNRADTLYELLNKSLIENNKQQKIDILKDAITHTVPILYNKKTKGGKRSKRTKRSKRSKRTKRTRRTRKN